MIRFLLKTNGGNARSPNTAVAATRIAAVLLISALVPGCGIGCGHALKTSVPSDAQPQPFKLSVHTERSETAHDPKTDSLTRSSFSSEITHFGHIEGTGETGPDDQFAYAYNDSIRFRTEKPYRLEAFMSADTLFSRSKSANSAVSSEASGPSDSMLVCIFQGPALQLTYDGESGTTIEHLKMNCPGGIYRRLDLPKTYGLFVTAIPQDKAPDRHSRWEQEKDLPSFSGLGYTPRLRLGYRVTSVEGEALNVDVNCDTTITHVSTQSPSGENVDIIANRIQVSGTLRMTSARFERAGRIQIREEIKYTRPALDTSVLTKTCVYEIRLEMFEDAPGASSTFDK